MKLAFNLPMKEALKFWSAKVPMTREDWDELVEAQQARSFMVSGLTKIDQISAVQDALADAIAAGTTFEDFKAGIADIIAQENWSGIRLQIIFRTNVQSAYMAGRYAQMQRVKEVRPYWQYDALNDSRTRPSHRAMDGKIFPADHPFWDKWMPPNGFRCRCGVNTVSAREIERDGLKVETKDPTGKLFEPKDARGNKMPARHLMPDPGFSGNIGKDWLAGLAPEEVQLSATKQATNPQFAETDLLPDGMNDEDYVAAFLRKIGAKNNETVVLVPVKGFSVALGAEMFKKDGRWAVKHNGRERYLGLLADTITSPQEKWIGPVSFEGRIYLTLTLIRKFSGKTVVFRMLGARKWACEFNADPKAFRHGERIS